MSKADSTIAIHALNRAIWGIGRELDRLLWIPPWARTKAIQREIALLNHETALFQHRLEVLRQRREARG